MKNLSTSIDKTLDILCAFAGENSELSALEISKLLGIPLSSTYKFLEKLSEKQLLYKDQETKKFRLGWMVYKLGERFKSENILLDAANQ